MNILMRTAVVANIVRPRSLIQALNLPKKNLNIAWSVIKKVAPCHSQQIKGAISAPQGSSYW